MKFSMGRNCIINTILAQSRIMIRIVLHSWLWSNAKLFLLLLLLSILLDWFLFLSFIHLLPQTSTVICQLPSGLSVFSDIRPTRSTDKVIDFFQFDHYVTHWNDLWPPITGSYWSGVLTKKIRWNKPCALI